MIIDNCINVDLRFDCGSFVKVNTLHDDINVIVDAHSGINVTTENNSNAIYVNSDTKSTINVNVSLLCGTGIAIHELPLMDKFTIPLLTIRGDKLYVKV